MVLRYILQEEEDEGGGSGGGYYNSIPQDLDELESWWKSTVNGIDYPLYAVFVASENDKEIRNRSRAIGQNILRKKSNVNHCNRTLNNWIECGDS